MVKGTKRFENTREIIQHIAEHCSETTKVVVCDETVKDTSVQTAQAVARAGAPAVPDAAGVARAGLARL